MHQIQNISFVEKATRSDSLNLVQTGGVSCKRSPFSRPMTLEHKEKLRQLSIGRAPWNKGKKVSEQTRLRMREAHRGEKCNFWKGGITSSNLAIRHSVEMRIWREKIFERDNYTCVWCGIRGVYLNADHIKSFAHYPELRFELSNGRTLCEPCHHKTPTFKNKKKI